MSPIEQSYDHAAMLKNFAIAITGGAATGKSTVADVLRNAGFPVVDADQLSRKVVSPGSEGLAAVVDAFGSDVLAASGELNRTKLRELVFEDPAKKKQLEQIIHPRLAEELTEWVAEQGLLSKPKLWFYEASLIFENDRAKDFRAVWSTICSPEEQLRRLIERYQGDEKMASSILAAQMDPKTKAEMADCVIETDADPSQVEKSVLALAHSALTN